MLASIKLLTYNPKPAEFFKRSMVSNADERNSRGMKHDSSHQNIATRVFTHHYGNT